MTEDDNVYIISEHSGKQFLHIISEFSSIFLGNKLLNIPVILRNIINKKYITRVKNNCHDTLKINSEQVYDCR